MSPLFPFVRARGAAVCVLIVVAIVAVTSGSRAQSPGAAQPAQQPPPFRAGTNFVHVDVYPTANGTTVPDLAAADFEVLEDGVPQKIETFEHVNIQGLTPEEAKAEPTSTREAASMAETTKGRLFVIFLDKYFVTLYGSHDIRRPLVNFLNRLLGPDDMFAVMTPDMSAADLSFARKTGTVEDNLRRFWFWGQKDDNILPDDPTEREVQECYGDSRMPATALNELVQRRREKKVIDALTDLTIYLRGVREGRKAVITVTGGWLLFRENKDLNTDPTTGMPKPIPVPPTGITTDGKITTDTSVENLGYSKSKCERDRFWLSTIDDRRDLYALFDLANRNNVSFYPINPMGLEASSRPIDQDRFVGRPNGTLLDPQSVQTKGEQDATAPRLATPSSLVEARTENLRELAASTDGIAVVDTNDLDRGMKRIAADLSSYYLLGYASTNAKLDGKFRKITVRVKRAGVDVRARRGYRAPTRKEVEEGATAEAPVTPGSALGRGDPGGARCAGARSSRRAAEDVGERGPDWRPVARVARRRARLVALPSAGVGGRRRGRHRGLDGGRDVPREQARRHHVRSARHRRRPWRTAGQRRDGAYEGHAAGRRTAVHRHDSLRRGHRRAPAAVETRTDHRRALCADRRGRSSAGRNAYGSKFRSVPTRPRCPRKSSIGPGSPSTFRCARPPASTAASRGRARRSCWPRLPQAITSFDSRPEVRVS